MFATVSLSLPRLLTFAYSAAGLASALSHIPQIRSAYANPEGAAAVSLSAWWSWTLSGIIAAVYAVVCTSDLPFILVSITSALGSAAVLGVALYRRR
jgi:hypothetical protein